MFWTGFLIGILVMSIFSFFTVLSFDNEKTFLGCVFAGPVLWIVNGLFVLLKTIKKISNHKKYKALLVCPDGKIRYTESNKADDIIESSDHVWPYWTNYAESEGWHKEDWNKEYIVMGIGNVRYAPKKVWKKYEKITK